MRILTLILALSFCFTAAAQEASPLAGSWQGALPTPGGMKLRLVLNVRAEKGKLSATLDSIDQGAKGLAVDEITLKDGTVRFAMKKLVASYEGTLSADKRSITGHFTQMGRKIPLTLARTDKPPTLDRPQTPKGPFPYRVEQVGFSHLPGVPLADSFEPKASSDEKRVSLAATLTLPKGDGPFPAIVLVSGSGPQDRDETILGHKPFAVLADHFTRKGFAVLRYDDRGTAKSTGSFATATTADHARDAASAARYLTTRKDIDTRRIGIMGHSEGGLIAPQVATRHDGIAFIVLLAGPGVGGQAILHHQTRLILGANGGSKETIARHVALQKDVYSVMRNDRIDDTAKRALVTAKMHAFIDAAPAAERKGVTREAFAKSQVAVLFTPWFRHFLTTDPAPALGKVTCPTLALFGARDLQVDPAQNAGPLTAALAAGKCKDYACITLPELNHLFQKCKTGSPAEYAQIAHTIHPSALRALSDWLLPRFGSVKK